MLLSMILERHSSSDGNRTWISCAWTILWVRCIKNHRENEKQKRSQPKIISLLMRSGYKRHIRPPMHWCWLSPWTNNLGADEEGGICEKLLIIGGLNQCAAIKRRDHGSRTCCSKFRSFHRMIIHMTQLDEWCRVHLLLGWPHYLYVCRLFISVDNGFDFTTKSRHRWLCET